MRHRSAATILVALLLAAASAAQAGADGLPVLGVNVGGSGVVAETGHARFVTLPARNNTMLAQINPAGGQVSRSLLLAGTYTIPAVAYDRTAGGLSADGSTLVLIEPRAAFPRARTRLLVVDAWNLKPRRTINLAGDFSFDAISPRGTLIYLIHYTNPDNPNKYNVRAYNLDSGHLLKQPITDPREPGEMNGAPLTRTSSHDGRWAYTLYDGAGTTPFIHALNTTTHTARCIDLDTLENTNLTNLHLTIDRNNRTLTISRNQQQLLTIDTTNYAAQPT